jgi:hypothetical protein
MMKLKMTAVSLALLLSSMAFAESRFVDLDQLDTVFENYSREGSGLWAVPEEFPIVKQIEGATVRSSHPGVANFEGPEKAFDGQIQSKYLASAKAIKLQVQLAGEPKRITSYAISSGNDFPARDPANWTLSGSNEGKKWQVLDERKGERFSGRHQRRTFDVGKPGDYSWYKLVVSKNKGAELTQLAELELLTPEEAKALVAQAAEDKPAEKSPAAAGAGWEPLFTPDLSNAQFPAGVWTVSNGELTASEDRLIITKEEYENFVLDLEFKTGPAANSGVFVYINDPKSLVQNSVEIQITDDHSEKWAKANPTYQCGAFFGRLAASERTVKPAGEWNHYTIICRGPFIDVILNGVHVNSMDTRKWDSPTHNPDGSKKPPWLSKALNHQPTKGRIGFQGKHGGAPIWFRNIKIKPLN